MYKPADLKIWKGRKVRNSNHYFDVVQNLDLTNDPWIPSTRRNFAILGFGCDEGVRRNKGRVGAKGAPDAIRKQLSRFAVHFDTNDVSICDSGTVFCSSKNLELVAELLQTKIEVLLKNEFIPIVLGGGHETAYPHFCAIQEYFGYKTKVGVINLDAHLDMRDYENGQHSGSPFRQILDDSVLKHFGFHYLPVGVRLESNNSSMLRIFRESGQRLITLEDLFDDFDKVISTINEFSNEVDKLYLTIDMDGFPAAYAPGVSASFPDGFLPFQVKKVIQELSRTEKLVSVDIVETNPDLDKDDLTAKLAAKLANFTINSLI